jgi:NAD(P)H-dependent flavin oxidoreductase YrpB (nitropropane dioxygenase family)
MTAAALRTRICDLFGIRYPIVQTGMGWVSGARLTAATSAAGGLGILASATMTLPQLEIAIREVRERTDEPFGVNLRTDQDDIDERVALLVRERVRVASFAQAPRKEIVLRLKDAGVLTMPTVGAKRHAEKVAALGVDAIIAQGHEGGGHTGPVPTTLLLPQVTSAVDVPVLGAGGFFDGRGLVAALAYGAAGIAMGTRFLLTRESTVPDAVKKLYLDTPVTGTVVTRAIDGYPQRVIRTAFVDALERSRGVLALARAAGHAWQFRALTGTSMVALLKEGLAMKKAQELTLGQMAMAANAPMLTKASMVDGRPEVGILPTGQVVGAIEELPTVQELIARIVREAEATLARLGAPGGGRYAAAASASELAPEAPGDGARS